MALATRQLDPIGVEILDVDLDTLLHGEGVGDELDALLEANGVILFRELGLDDAQQVALAARMGEVQVKSSGAYGQDPDNPAIFRVSLNPEINNGPFMKATFDWHIDGTSDDLPTKASLLSARVLPPRGTGGDTQFASTYAAYDLLSDDEKARFEDMKVVHSVVAAWRHFDPDADPALLERLAAMGEHVHPLVWTHRTGRKSLVLGGTAAYVEGLPEDEGFALVEDLLARATTPDLVLNHEWSLGDLVIWDNRGVLHRATPYDETSGRDMHRVNLVGDEPIA